MLIQWIFWFDVYIRWEVIRGYLLSQRKTTYSAGKEQSQEAMILSSKEQSTDSHSLSPTIILSNLPKLSSRLAASIPMWISMAIFAWTFFRYKTTHLASCLLLIPWSFKATICQRSTSTLTNICFHILL